MMSGNPISTFVCILFFILFIHLQRAKRNRSKKNDAIAATKQDTIIAPPCIPQNSSSYLTFQNNDEKMENAQNRMQLKITKMNPPPKKIKRLPAQPIFFIFCVICIESK